MIAHYRFVKRIKTKRVKICSPPILPWLSATWLSYGLLSAQLGGRHAEGCRKCLAAERHRPASPPPPPSPPGSHCPVNPVSVALYHADYALSLYRDMVSG